MFINGIYSYDKKTMNRLFFFVMLLPSHVIPTSLSAFTSVFPYETTFLKPDKTFSGYTILTKKEIRLSWLI